MLHAEGAHAFLRNALRRSILRLSIAGRQFLVLLFSLHIARYVVAFLAEVGRSKAKEHRYAAAEATFPFNEIFA